MTEKKWLSIFILFIFILSGCERNSTDIVNDTKVADDEEYNLMITNNSPLYLRSVVVTIEEEDDVQINSLIDSNISFGKVAKFPIKNGKRLFKITLNPKDNYSVSKEFSEVFNEGEIVEYQILIEQNEVSIQRIKDNE
ncbi:hypothetical protein [Paenibacillus donghaensis]|uniref:Uncharacterized protein n=1 Tax=Paenibacillus donghaensis TaxID=414771 RepID=A0A2Z2KS06_9BACL|nr:hypothetical protein [Paenibacillus donghaensis]ASA23311.1 hypothetical protein B9T62_22400 [Paenibacillus donghaensis]